MSLRQVAEIVGLTTGTVSRYERGILKPRQRTSYKFEKRLPGFSRE